MQEGAVPYWNDAFFASCPATGEKKQVVRFAFYAGQPSSPFREASAM